MELFGGGGTVTTAAEKRDGIYAKSLGGRKTQAQKKKIKGIPRMEGTQG